MAESMPSARNRSEPLLNAVKGFLLSAIWKALHRLKDTRKMRAILTSEQINVILLRDDFNLMLSTGELSMASSFSSIYLVGLDWILNIFGDHANDMQTMKIGIVIRSVLLL